MITAEEALRIAHGYVEDEHAYYCHVDGLLQDGEDYFILLALNDGHFEWPLGPSPLFVAKRTGEVWSDAYGNVLDKIAAMKAV